MKIEIPFDENTFRNQMLFVFENAYNKHLHSNKINLYYGLFFLFVSCVSYFELNPDSNLPIISLIIGVIILGVSIKYYNEYKTKRKTYIALIDKEIEEHLRIDQSSIFEYNGEFIRWKNFKIDFKINWEGIKLFEVKGNNIIIGIADKTPLIIIGQEEIKDRYEEILSIAKSKGIIFF